MILSISKTRRLNPSKTLSLSLLPLFSDTMKEAKKRTTTIYLKDLNIPMINSYFSETYFLLGYIPKRISFVNILSIEYYINNK